MSLKQANSSQ